MLSFILHVLSLIRVQWDNWKFNFVFALNPPYRFWQEYHLERNYIKRYVYQWQSMTIRCYAVNKIIEIWCNRFKWSPLRIYIGLCSMNYNDKLPNNNLNKNSNKTFIWEIINLTKESSSITELLVLDRYYLILMFKLLTKWLVLFVEADNSVCRNRIFDLECCIQVVLFTLFVSAWKSFQWSAVFPRFIG